MTAWTPARLGTSLRVDIDPEQFTGLVDADPITTGQDASGNGRDFTASGSARPTYQTGELAGKAVMRFDGSNDKGTIADTGLTGQPFTVAIVARFSSPLSADASLLAGSGFAIGYTVVGSDAGLAIDLGDAKIADAWYGGTVTTTPLIVAGGVEDGLTRWRAFDQQPFSTQDFGATGYPDALTVSADAAGTGDFAAMDLARLIVAEGLSSSDLDYLLGYLAWEYGLEATLPTDFVYAAAAPEAVSPIEAPYRVLTQDEFDALPAPTSDEVGTAVFVKTPSGSIDFLSVARTLPDDSREWYVNADSFQLFIANNANFSNVGHLGAGAQSAIGANTVGADLTDWTEVRLAGNVGVAGNTGEMYVVYSTNNFSSVTELMSQRIDLGASGFFVLDWEAIPSGARNPVSFGVRGINGDGVENPAVYSLVAHFRR